MCMCVSVCMYILGSVGSCAHASTHTKMCMCVLKLENQLKCHFHEGWLPFLK